MQKKMGKVNNAEIGIWHEEKNNSQRITQLLKDAYTNVTSPRLIILAPVKCETYTKTPREAENLLNHVKIGYSKLLDFFKSDSLIGKVAVVITPVQTIGNVVFSHAKTDDDGYTKFYYHKTPINSSYEPRDGDQPLRYILMFLINVFLENKKEILKKEQQKFEGLTSKLGRDKLQLDKDKREFDEKQRLLNKRNNMWWLARAIVNIFDDRESPYNTAKGQYEQKKVDFQETQSNFKSSELIVQATEEQINVFNNAVYKFAIGYKNNDGFAIIQGHKWFKFTQPIFY